MTILENIKTSLLNLLKLPDADRSFENDKSASEAHYKIVRSKPFLTKVFRLYYSEFLKAEHSLQIEGVSLEIGSGGGFLKEVYPEIVTSDILPLPHVDRQEDACRLNFTDESLKGIYGLQTLHHISKPRVFFREAIRVLKPGGKMVFIEPYTSPFGRFIYKNFHHEPCDYTVLQWEFTQTTVLNDSNQALPTLIFKRDRKQFELEFPELKIESVHYHTFLIYLLSGGLRYRSLLPGFLFGPALLIEKLLSPLMPWIGTMQTIVLAKQAK